MYNLLEYSKNYRKTTGSLWNYYRDETSDPLSSNSESLKYETTINTYNAGAGGAGYDIKKVGKNGTEVVIPLKCLSKLQRILNIPLINCGIELILTLSKNCVLADMTTANNSPTGLEFQIKETKLYAPIVNLSKKKKKKKKKAKNFYNN